MTIEADQSPAVAGGRRLGKMRDVLVIDRSVHVDLASQATQARTQDDADARRVLPFRADQNRSFLNLVVKFEHFSIADWGFRMANFIGDR